MSACLKSVVAGVVVFSAFMSPVFSETFYVASDGSSIYPYDSWFNASTDLQVAIDAAAATSEPSEVWVKQGVYHPVSDPHGVGEGSRGYHFALRNEVAIYGGFYGDATTREERNPDPETNGTILSGDLNGDDTWKDGNPIVDAGGSFNSPSGDPDADLPMANNAENCFHVVYNPIQDPVLNSRAVLDGFVITGGMANVLLVLNDQRSQGGGIHNRGSSPTIRRCLLAGNFAISGGGLWNRECSVLTQLCTFMGNYAGYDGGTGGGVYSYRAGAIFSDCCFRGNYSDVSGGGLRNYDGDIIVEGCSFIGNASGEYGGGMESMLASPAISNCTFSGNRSPEGGGVSVRWTSRALLAGCNFSENIATSGGALHCDESDANCLAASCIFWGDGSGETDGAGFNASQVHYSIIEGDIAGFGPGCLNQDPELGPLNYHDGPTECYSVPATSPAVGAGVFIYRVASAGNIAVYLDPLSGDYIRLDDGTIYDASGQTMICLNALDQRGYSRRAPVTIGSYQFSPTPTPHGYKTPTMSPTPSLTPTPSPTPHGYKSPSPTVTTTPTPVPTPGFFTVTFYSSTSMYIYPTNAITIDRGDMVTWYLTFDHDPRPLDYFWLRSDGLFGYKELPVCYKYDCPAGRYGFVAGNRYGASVGGTVYVLASPTPYGYKSPTSTPAGYKTPTRTPTPTITPTVTPSPSASPTPYGFKSPSSTPTMTPTVTPTPQIAGNMVCYVASDGATVYPFDSWFNAATDPQKAIDAALAAENHSEVWVKRGVYKPISDPHGIGDGSRGYHFTLRNDIAIYGGFYGTETTRVERNPAVNQTILSGDHDGNDAMWYGTPLIGPDGKFNPPDFQSIIGQEENSYHVVYNPAQTPVLDNSSILDGFIITGGCADKIHTVHENGGGIYNSGYSPIIRRCLISGNKAGFGGGIWCGDCAMVMENCEIRGNRAQFDDFYGAEVQGGGGSLWSSTILLEDCRFLYNRSWSSVGSCSGAALHVAGGEIILKGSSFIGSRFCGWGGANGELILNDVSSELSNCTFSSGVISANYGSVLVLSSCTFNKSLVNCDTDSNFLAVACIFWGETIGGNINPARFYYSVVEEDITGYGAGCLNQDPLLGTLDYHGGPTECYSISGTSPAVVAGVFVYRVTSDGDIPVYLDPSSGNYIKLNDATVYDAAGQTLVCLNLTDQRGYYRSGGVTIGSYQYNASLTSPTPYGYKTATPTVTPVTPSATPTPSPSPSSIPSPSVTPSATPTTSIIPTSTATPIPTPSLYPTPKYLVLGSGDYDGDGKTDLAIFRPDQGLWIVRGMGRLYFGRPGDIPAPGDYDGDGITNPAYYRPDVSLWVIKDKTRFYFGSGPAGIPAPADYDGDGTCDPTIFDPDLGCWMVRGVTRAWFGQNGDLPVPGDYDGNGSVDLAYFRGSTGLWFVRGLSRFYLGQEGDVPMPGRYSWRVPPVSQPAVFRPAQGLWIVRGLTRYCFGVDGDTPLRGCFENGLIEQPAYFRPEKIRWKIKDESQVWFGRVGDIPLSR